MYTLRSESAGNWLLYLATKLLGRC